MRLVDAVYERIMQLLQERAMTAYRLAQVSGVPHATIATMRRSNTVKLSTVYGVCDGLEMSLQEFFASPLFARENIED